MNKGINLLDYKSKIFTPHRRKKNDPLRIVAIAMLFLVSALSVTLFILIALSPLPELSKQKKAAIFNLSLATSDIVRLGLVNDRLFEIDKVLKSRLEYDKTLDAVQSQIPLDVNIDSFEISNNKMIITLTSLSLDSLNQFLDKLNTPEDNEKRFSKITISNLSSVNGSNNFTMTILIEI